VRNQTGTADCLKREQLREKRLARDENTDDLETILSPFSLIRDFGKQNTCGNVS